MTEDILNKIYADFNKGYVSSSIIKIIEKLCPEMSNDEKEDISNYLVSARKEINDYFYSWYNYKDDEANQALQRKGNAWVRTMYSWMNEENIEHAISVAMYYAWHG